MAGPVDAILKVSIAAAALFAQRDAQVDRERRLEGARVDLVKQAEQARQATEKREQQDRQAADREAVQTRYRVCISNVEKNYSSSWTDECKKASDKAKKERSDCFAKGTGREMCDIFHPVKEFLSDCTLSGGIGKGLNDQLERSRARCLQESQLGLQ